MGKMDARLLRQSRLALSGQRAFRGKKRVAPLEERNPEADAGVKGATWSSSYREHRPVNGDSVGAIRGETQAFPWKWLSQRIAEPLPVERAPARSRRRLALDAGGGLCIIRGPGATRTCLVGLGGSYHRPPSPTNRGVANTIS